MGLCCYDKLRNYQKVHFQLSHFVNIHTPVHLRCCKTSHVGRFHHPNFVRRSCERRQLIAVCFVSLHHSHDLQMSLEKKRKNNLQNERSICIKVTNTRQIRYRTDTNFVNYYENCDKYSKNQRKNKLILTTKSSSV